MPQWFTGLFADHPWGWLSGRAAQHKKHTEGETQVRVRLHPTCERIEFKVGET